MVQRLVRDQALLVHKTIDGIVGVSWPHFPNFIVGQVRPKTEHVLGHLFLVAFGEQAETGGIDGADRHTRDHVILVVRCFQAIDYGLHHANLVGAL